MRCGFPGAVLGRQRGSYQAEYEGEEEGREGSPALQYTLAPNVSRCRLLPGAAPFFAAA